MFTWPSHFFQHFSVAVPVDKNWLTRHRMKDMDIDFYMINSHGSKLVTRVSRNWPFVQKIEKHLKRYKSCQPYKPYFWQQERFFLFLRDDSTPTLQVKYALKLTFLPAHFSSYVVFFVTYIAIVCCEPVRRKHPGNIIILCVFTLALSLMVGVISGK